MDSTKELVAIDKLSHGHITSEIVNTPDFAESYKSLMVLIQRLEGLKQSVDNDVKALMRERYFATGENSVSQNGIRHTYVPATTREAFDSKAFKKDNPDLFKKYVKISSVSDSLKTSLVEPDASQEEKEDVVSIE